MVNDWKEDQSVKDWLQGLEEKTKNNYVTYFPRFLRFINMTPDEIIQSRLKDLSSTDPKTKFHWEQQVLGYQDSLKKEGKKGYTLHDYIKSGGARGLATPTRADFYGEVDAMLKHGKSGRQGPKRAVSETLVAGIAARLC